jgi:hypothetical protein
MNTEPMEDPVAMSFRFKVTTEKRVFFVYGFDEANAISRLTDAQRMGASVEPAGHVDNGELHIPLKEQQTIMASLAGRDAPVRP